MKFYEFGNETQPVLLCMHGMMQSWESMYQIVKPLEQSFRLLLPAMDGFYEGSGDFTSFADQAKQIEDFVTDKHEGKLHGVYAISQGALLMTEVLTRNRIALEKTVFDGTYVAHQGKFSGWCTYKMLRHMKYHRDSAPKLGLITLSLMGWTKERAELALRQLKNRLFWDASDESIRRNCLENYTYTVRAELAKARTELHLWCGEKEKYAIKSHDILKKYLKPSEEKIFAGLGHGEFASLHPSELQSRLEQVFGAP